MSKALLNVQNRNSTVVNTDWVEDHLFDKNVRIIEVDYDFVNSYQTCHIPGAVLLKWKEDLNNYLTREILSRISYQHLLKKIGINNDTTVVLYGDFNNWFAAFAFWIFKYYQFKDVRLIDGGRRKWLEENRQVSKKILQYKKGNFVASQPQDSSIRASYSYINDNLWYVKEGSRKVLVDARSYDEFIGKILSPPEYPNENPQRGGHIPGAINIPWDSTIKDDGTFKAYEELLFLYRKGSYT